jgi:tetratricopeptide (TPR) repeat protein
MAYHFLGESDKGIEYLKKSISYYMSGSPFLAQPYNNLGVVYSERELYDEALEAFKEAIRLNGKDPNAYNNLGRLYYLKGEYQKAISGFKKAMEIDPFYSRGYVNLAIAYKEAGLLQEAEVMCKRTLEITPKDVKALMNLVDIYKMQGRKGEMFQKLNEIIHYYPEAFIAYNRLGREYFEEGAYDKALNALRSSLMIRSNCPETHLNIASVYCYGFNSYRKAREHLECLLKLDPGSVRKKEVTDLATRINRYLSKDNSLSG